MTKNKNLSLKIKDGRNIPKKRENIGRDATPRDKKYLGCKIH
jgi:hypothetical protein